VICRHRTLTAALLTVLIVGVCAAAERQWQTGTWTDAGTKMTPWVRDPVRGTGPLGGIDGQVLMSAVGWYMIETADLQFELEDILPIGQRGSFALSVTMGATVTFALSKNTAYIRRADGTEYRLHVVNRRTKPRAQ
jgi:hypothetical protein